MTIFIRLLADRDKARGLLDTCLAVRANFDDPRIFKVAPDAFQAVPGAPFAYWIGETVRSAFKRFPAFESNGRTARQGLATAEDFRFLRLWWERPGRGWHGFAKGGVFSPYYSDVHLMAKWVDDGAEIKSGICQRYPYLNGNAEFVAKNTQFYFRPGLTWPRRTKSRLSMRVMPAGCIFADKGPAALDIEDREEVLFALLAVCLSAAFHTLVEVQLAAGDERPGGAAHSFEVGVIQRSPIPNLGSDEQATLAELARCAWSHKRTLDTVEETSHAFLLPEALRARLSEYDPTSIQNELVKLQDKIDVLSCKLYGFADLVAGRSNQASTVTTEPLNGDASEDDADDEDVAAPIDQSAGLLSWAIGVAFGRFDWRLATGEREAPPTPDPFDPLPARSPGMLCDAAEPFQRQAGILVDEPGHPQDLPRLLEDVLARVETSVTLDVRRWLQRDFFPTHLQRYSKSRRRAPIYWPLSTTSGSYTLWCYYPSLTSQTLYTLVNDFIDPKLKQVRDDAERLRSKAEARTRDEDRKLELLQVLDAEVTELRDALLLIAPTYTPNHEDGVQISAAPLWSLFRHKPWQKLLKETWVKLEKGDYDWAHLAMTYWPDRIREKCKTDKSLAIAHDLEHLYVPPEPKAAKPRGRKKASEA